MSKKIDSAELNYDMNYNLFLLKTAMPNLKTAKGNYSDNTDRTAGVELSCSETLIGTESNINSDLKTQKIMYKNKIVFQYSTIIIEKTNVTRWVHKLLSSNKTMSEMRLRNEFMFHLVIAVQEGDLRPPFSQNPPSSSPLSNLRYLLTGASPNPNEKDAKKDSNAWECDDSDGEDAGKPMLYKQSPDGGAFLAAQPVPKCGAFSYVAVVSKPPVKEEDYHK